MGWLLNTISKGLANLFVSSKKGFLQERIDHINNEHKKIQVNYANALNSLADAFSSDNVYKMNIYNLENKDNPESQIRSNLDNFGYMELMKPYIEEKYISIWKEYLKYKKKHPDLFQHYIKFKNVKCKVPDMPNTGDDKQDILDCYSEYNRLSDEFDKREEDDYNLALKLDKERQERELRKKLEVKIRKEIKNKIKKGEN